MMTTAQSLPILSEQELRGAACSLPESWDKTEAGFGALITARSALPLRAVEVDAQVAGLVAHVELKQTFHNSLDERLEATYIFPLPSRAAVTGFRLEVNGRILEGVVKERQEAREEYEQAIEQGHRAAITEEERPGTFSMRCGNILPGETALLTLSMEAPLPYEDGEANFRFPLLVAPRYVPGVPLRGPQVGDGGAVDTDLVPDASRISPPVLLPGFPNPVQLKIQVEIDSLTAPIANLRSSLHAIDHITETMNSNSGQDVGKLEPNDRDPLLTRRVHKISLQPNELAPDGKSANTKIDRDFILRWTLGHDADVSSAAAISWDDTSSEANRKDTKKHGQEGTFQLVVVPPSGSTQGQVPQQVPRDVVFLLDRSGSMGNWQIVAARRATARMLETLTLQDHFALLAFDDFIETPSGLSDTKLSDATDRNRAIAVEFLASIEARGGTEMASPLLKAADLLTPTEVREQDEKRDRVLVLVTDGQVGNEDHILAELSKKLKGQVRIFTLGIDRNVNEGFLKRLADMGRGQSLLVESEARLEEAMAAINRAVGTPLISDIRVDLATGTEGETMELVSLVPARVPDLFAGVPLVITGRLHLRDSNGRVSNTSSQSDKWPKLRLRVYGVRTGGTMAWEEVVSLIPTLNKALTPIWARGKIRELEDSYLTTSWEGRGSIERDVVSLSLRYKILSRFTAFVAVDRSEKVNVDHPMERIMQPVKLDSAKSAAPLMLMNMNAVMRSGERLESLDECLNMDVCMRRSFYRSRRSMLLGGSAKSIFSWATARLSMKTAQPCSASAAPPPPAASSLPLGAQTLDIEDELLEEVQKAEKLLSMQPSPPADELLTSVKDLLVKVTASLQNAGVWQAVEPQKLAELQKVESDLQSVVNQVEDAEREGKDWRTGEGGKVSPTLKALVAVLKDAADRLKSVLQKTSQPVPAKRSLFWK